MHLYFSNSKSSVINFFVYNKEQINLREHIGSQRTNPIEYVKDPTVISGKDNISPSKNIPAA